ncbi:12248_t:CDS:2 [Entrophospora sp. SA101]|nr:13908_t:CDS:2 [Entrophospora sp. SA101]CAJ0637812.1 2574_t:CDS:2 [Entrophospora sp. SA101]CAJ0761782.1 12248_t:CDS:2 [Entrophospora sp. SA101]CAJ0847699.1 10769_t:CDS:2 [Entrophospora sp. SA101]CAJ0869575.1 6949_t:CDS:2 [Entrophospora sp. SA101]
MNKNDAIKVLTREEEVKLLRQAQKGKTQAERERAARLLVYYNQSFVKYMVKGFHYPQGEISSDELTAEGVISLPQAIKDFDLAKSENRLASYAGEEEGTERKIPTKTPSTGIVYYDRDYQTGEKDDKTTSLLDTLADGDEKMEQQIQQRETKRKINDLLACLEIHEELIVRLFFGIVPTNSSQIDRLATKEKAKELKKPKKYFREFPESAAKPQTSRRGYQPEDFADPQSQILQKIGIAKKEKEQWQKASSKTKIKNWLEQRLAKAMENRKKDILEKLKILREEKP